MSASLLIAFSTLASPQPGQPTLAILYNGNQGLGSLLEADPQMRIIGIVAGGHALLIDFRRLDLSQVDLAGVAFILRAPPLAGLCHN